MNIKINPSKKYDLYTHGNYIASFSSMESLNEFLLNEAKQSKYMSYDIVRYMNNKKYSVIESNHIEFSEN